MNFKTMLKNLFVLTIIATTTFCSNPKSHIPTSKTSTKTTSSSESSIEVYFQKELLQLVNDLRAKGCRCGRKRMKRVGPLKLNHILAKAAQGHANDMLRNNFFEHEGSDGSSPGERVKRAGYDWMNVGENIYWGDSNVQEVFLGWKKSPSHCKAMMDPDYTEMGVAKADKYWVQDFGRLKNW